MARHAGRGRGCGRSPLPDAAPTLDRPDGSWLETSRTADAVRVTAEEAGVRVTEVSADPGHPLERLADLVALTDFAAVYLALANGVDPVTSPDVACVTVPADHPLITR